MSEKLHIGDGALRELLHLFSHDLRNPLAAIMTNLEFARRIVEEHEVDADLRESIEDSVVACDVLKRIVSNFDVLAKGDGLMTSPANVDVGEIAQEVARRCRDRARQARLAIEVETGGVREVAVIDKSFFALALENLLANSIQHAPRDTKIAVRLCRREGSLTVTVTDEGAPIPESHRDEALSPVAHTPEGRKGPTRYGRGLSLLAARGAAEAAGLTLGLGEHDGRFEMALAFPTDGA